MPLSVGDMLRDYLVPIVLAGVFFIGVAIILGVIRRAGRTKGGDPAGDAIRRRRQR